MCIRDRIIISIGFNGQKRNVYIPKSPNQTTMKIVYVHVSSNPYPVTKTFFGQTFAIASMLRHQAEFPENGVLMNEIWCTEPELSDRRLRTRYTDIAGELVFHNTCALLEHNFMDGCLPSGAFKRSLLEKVSRGYLPVVVHHYPIGARNASFIYELDRWRREMGLSGSIAVVSYIHTLADIYDPRELHSSLGPIASGSDSFVGVSDAVSSDFTRLLGKSVEVIHNGINLEMYKPASMNEVSALRKGIGLSPSLEKVVCFSGRLSREKGVSVLLQVLQKFNSSASGKMRDVGFVIATPHIFHNGSIPRIMKCFLSLDLSLIHISEPTRPY